MDRTMPPGLVENSTDTDCLISNETDFTFLDLDSNFASGASENFVPEESGYILGSAGCPMGSSGIWQGRSTPMMYIDRKTKERLVVDLNVCGPDHGWARVAELLGCYEPTTIIHWSVLRDNNSGCAADLLLEDCTTKSGSDVTIEIFLEALQVADNQTAYAHLMRAYPDAVKRHLEDVKSTKRVIRDCVEKQRYEVENEVNVKRENENRNTSKANEMNLEMKSNNSPVGGNVVRRDRQSNTSPASSVSKLSPRSWVRNSCPGTNSDFNQLELDPLLRQLKLEGSSHTGNSTSIAGPERKGDVTVSRGLPEPESRDGRQGGNRDGRTVGMTSGLLHSRSAGSDIQTAPFNKVSRQIHVLLTYTCETRKQMRDVTNLSDCLKKNNFSVSHEENESHNLARDKLGWLDGQFKRAEYILVLVTSEYARDVASIMPFAVFGNSNSHTSDQSQASTQAGVNESLRPLLRPANLDTQSQHLKQSAAAAFQPQKSAKNRKTQDAMQPNTSENHRQPQNGNQVSTQNRAVLVDPSDRCLNARYVYRLMQMEYFHKNCHNTRFIPVLMPSAIKDSSAQNRNGRELVPNWLQNTLIYQWPKDYRNLLYYMMKPESVLERFARKKNSGQDSKPIVITHH